MNMPMESGINKMKVLWYTNTPSLYEESNHQYHGGGWIESLEELVKTRPEIKLSIAFFHPYDNERIEKNGVLYYPIRRLAGRKNPVKALLNNWRGKIEQKEYQNRFLKIIDDFKPDIIHVFGTEGPFALIQEITSVPVIVHLQGIINPILNSYFPIGYSKLDFLLDRKYLFQNLIGASPPFILKRFKFMAEREKQVLTKIKYVFGRTEWDKRVVSLYNPDVRYFHVNEVLRPNFYSWDHKRNLSGKKFTIISTLSPAVYKGIDLVLRVAREFKALTDIEFEWRVIGIDESSKLLKLFERKERVFHRSVNIKLLGRIGPVELAQHMTSADIFVHPSYIDNSPNSVCEAQILELPVIACNVGGVSSLIDHEETGILIPSNGVFEMVTYLKLLYNNPQLRQCIGGKAREKAIERHNRQEIVERLISVYFELK